MRFTQTHQIVASIHQKSTCNCILNQDLHKCKSKNDPHQYTCTENIYKH